MATFIPESKLLLNRRTASGWDSHHVCKTLIIWYPDLLRDAPVHPGMGDGRRVLEFLAWILDFPADLQDILLLMARQYGPEQAHESLDNAIRKYLEERRAGQCRRAGDRRPPGKRRNHSFGVVSPESSEA